MFLLDTNICIYIINKKPPHVLEKLKSVIADGVAISSITVAELEYGISKSRNVEKNTIALIEFLAPFEIVDFNSADSRIYGTLRARLESKGEPVGPYDMLIAAQAISRGYTLVTNNIAEFRRIEDLKFDNWL
jgi:tRNA(fMet)-specific endonuclease VapC